MNVVEPMLADPALRGSRTEFGTNPLQSLKRHCEQLANTAPDNVQEIGSLLQKMIVAYYQDVRRQAIMAFGAAFVLEMVAVAFFIYAAVSAMSRNDDNAWLSTVAGLLIQIMTAVVFYLYAQAARQFAGFHICLERTNRFLLANAMVEHLPEAEQVRKRAEVITTVLNAPILTIEMIEKGRTA